MSAKMNIHVFLSITCKQLVLVFCMFHSVFLSSQNAYYTTLTSNEESLNEQSNRLSPIQSIYKPLVANSEESKLSNRLYNGKYC